MKENSRLQNQIKKDAVFMVNVRHDYKKKLYTLFAKELNQKE